MSNNFGAFLYIIKYFGTFVDVYSKMSAISGKEVKGFGRFLFYIANKYFCKTFRDRVIEKLPQPKKRLLIIGTALDDYISAEYIEQLTAISAATYEYNHGMKLRIAAFPSLRKLVLVGDKFNFADIFLNCGQVQELIIITKSSMRDYFADIEKMPRLCKLIIIGSTDACLLDAAKAFSHLGSFTGLSRKKLAEVLGRDKLKNAGYSSDATLFKKYISTADAALSQRYIISKKLWPDVFSFDYKTNIRILNISGDMKIKFPALAAEFLPHLREMYLHKFQIISLPRFDDIDVISFNQCCFICRSTLIETQAAGSIIFLKCETQEINIYANRIDRLFLLEEPQHIIGYKRNIRDFYPLMCNVKINKLIIGNHISDLTRANLLDFNKIIKIRLDDFAQYYVGYKNTQPGILTQWKSFKETNKEKYPINAIEKCGTRISAALGLEKLYFYSCFIKDPEAEIKRTNKYAAFLQ